jgi:8-oxo-dGTP pyrophosphatase MutT (NUDIX family)
VFYGYTQRKLRDSIGQLQPSTKRLVHYRRLNGTTYWQLPGGGIEAHEYPETATLRELAEETGLTGRIVHQLFVLSYKYGCSTTYLVEVDDYTALHPGYDPEECHAEHQKLIDVAWRSLNAMCGNPEIDALTCALTTLQSPFDDASDSQCSIETP